MTKPTIVTNTDDDVDIMAADAMPGGKPAAWFGRWVVFFRGNQEPEIMLDNEVLIQAEINRQRAERRKARK